MDNFNFYNPVKVIFGKEKIAELNHEITKDARILMIYGGGSIKKNGVYEQVKKALGDRTIVEFGGIEPNPHYETLLKGVELVHREKINFLLAVGGGSVIDGTKFIATAACFEGTNPWTILSENATVNTALPLGTVLTLPATGSEMNGNSVVTRVETKEKLAFSSPHVYPRFSILDPEVTYSLPQRQVANGVVDAFVHTMEQYYTYPNSSFIEDKMSESVLKTLLELGPRLHNAPSPVYEDRANFMWTATIALNGWLGCGVPQDWATHHIGHELTALHGLDHAVTLAIVLPGVMALTAQKRIVKFQQYAKNVLGITADSDEYITRTIAVTESFFNEMGIKTHLSDYGIGEDTIEIIVSRFKERGTASISLLQDITPEDVRTILISRL